MNDAWMNNGFEDDQLKPYIEPQCHIQNRIIGRA